MRYIFIPLHLSKSLYWGCFTSLPPIRVYLHDETLQSCLKLNPFIWQLIAFLYFYFSIFQALLLILKLIVPHNLYLSEPFLSFSFLIWIMRNKYRYLSLIYWTHQAILIIDPLLLLTLERTRYWIYDSTPPILSISLEG